jgi:hypothetical protein
MDHIWKGETDSECYHGHSEKVKGKSVPEKIQNWNQILRGTEKHNLRYN